MEGTSEGLSAPPLLRGVLGVRGRLWLPSLFVGVPGMGARVALGLNGDVVILRDSTESGALYFLCVEFRRTG